MRLIDTKLEQALCADNTLAVSIEQARTHPGFTEAHMLSCGLTRADLKKLERQGRALRGYTKNVWFPGETLPNGHKALGEMLPLPKRVEVPYVDARGYARKHVTYETVNYPDRTYRGSGHKIRWILITA